MSTVQESDASQPKQQQQYIAHSDDTKHSATNTGGRTPTLNTDVDDPSHPLHQHRRIVTDFEYKEILGEGSYSTVQAGRDKRTGKMYAIKRLDKAHIVKNNKVKYVMIERDALSRMNHPGIIKLYWTFKDNRSLYFVLDLARNGELYTYIRQLAPFDMETTRFYAAELLLAIEHIHYRGVVHRDIKPENILLDDNLHIKVTDFGSAKIVLDENNNDNGSNGSEPATPCRSFVGTAEYVSPELLRSDPVSFETDFWALGCVIYQMLSGRSPFKAPTDYLIFQKIKNLEYVMPDEFPETAQDLIRKLLEPQPEQRLGSEATGGIQAIKQHPFFQGIDWEHLYSSHAPPLRERLDRVLKARAAAAAANSNGAEPSASSTAALAMAFATSSQPLFSPSFEFAHPDLLSNDKKKEEEEEEEKSMKDLQHRTQQLYTPYSSGAAAATATAPHIASLEGDLGRDSVHPTTHSSCSEKNPFDDQENSAHGSHIKTASQDTTGLVSTISSDVAGSSSANQREIDQDDHIRGRKSHVFVDSIDKRSSQVSSAMSSANSIHPADHHNANNINRNDTNNNNSLCEGDKSTSTHPLWIPHLYPNESVIKSGRVLRKRGLITKKRNLILTNRPRLLYLDEGKGTTTNHTTTTSQHSSSHRNSNMKNQSKNSNTAIATSTTTTESHQGHGGAISSRRGDLQRIDIGNLRCEIPWTPQLFLELKGKSTFCIRTPEKNYTFEDKEHAEEWVNLINSMLIDSFGVAG